MPLGGKVLIPGFTGSLLGGNGRGVIMLMEIPFFMSNPEWYRHDEVSRRLVLTDKAPEEAVRSYREFYAALRESCLPIIEDPDSWYS